MITTSLFAGSFTNGEILLHDFDTVNGNGRFLIRVGFVFAEERTPADFHARVFSGGAELTDPTAEELRTTLGQLENGLLTVRGTQMQVKATPDPEDHFFVVSQAPHLTSNKSFVQNGGKLAILFESDTAVEGEDANVQVIVEVVEFEGTDDLTAEAVAAILESVVEQAIPLVRPYEIYALSLAHTGTDAPVATVFENTLDEGSPVWARSNVGVYTATLVGAFPAGQVFESQGMLDPDTRFTFRRTSNDVMTLTITDAAGDPLELSGVTAVLPLILELRVYL